MPFADTIGVEWAWVIPALSVSAFFITVIFGKFLPRQGAYVPIAAIFIGFCPLLVRAGGPAGQRAGRL